MTQGELEKLPIPVGRAFSNLEARIMADIVQRIKINGFSSATADWQITRIQQLGESEENIKKWIKEALEVSDQEIEKIFSDEVYRQYYGHERAYKMHGMHQVPFEENVPLQQLTESMKRQTKDTFQNITGSLGFVKQGVPGGKVISISLNDFYRYSLDMAMHDIHSGAFDYQTVLMRTITDMTKSGLRWIDYDSGWHNRVDVAARRAIMTGFRQVQGKINEQVAEQLGTDSYEVTCHVGARPEHQAWQGRVWTMRQLIDICGLGTVTGLHGANCYHDYNVFIPGVSVRTYTDKQLDQMKVEENSPRIYNGKEYTTYEALRQQRKMETSMRATRCQIKLLKEGGADENTVILKKARYQGQMQTYKDFSKKMKLPEQMDRVYQDGLKGKFSPIKTEKAKVDRMTQAKAQAVAEKVRRSKFSERFSEYNNGQKDVITTRKLMNNLNKSDIGKETVRYISEHPELNIQMCYKVDAPEGVLGMQDKNDIYVYATRTATVQKTAETIIHEITHYKYDIGGSQWAECVCRAQELKHRYNVDKLTEQQLRDIIKSIQKDYPELKWR